MTGRDESPAAQAKQLRNQQILAMAKAGRTRQQIAFRVNVSPRTVQRVIEAARRIGAGADGVS